MTTVLVILGILIGVPILFILAIFVHVWVFMLREIISAIAIILIAYFLWHIIVQAHNNPDIAPTLSWQGYQNYQERRDNAYRQLWGCRRQQKPTVEDWQRCNHLFSDVMNQGRR